MIASPGDVSAERQIIRDVIHEWNDINAYSAKTMLAPIASETHASPELGARPQELINNRLLKDCDLLIGVFWTKLGTPTGVSASGTVEEIEKHLDAGKPAMVYFSNTPVAPESLDHEVFSQLRLFKEKCKSLGLIETFDTRDEFRHKVARQLQVSLLANPHLSALRNELSIAIQAPTQRPKSIELSAEASKLLKAAASSKDGLIFKREFIGGRNISVGDKQFGNESSKAFAKWMQALGDLLRLNLIAERGYKGELFELTHQGWTLAEKL